jgi:serine/threonine protein kinase
VYSTKVSNHNISHSLKFPELTLGTVLGRGGFCVVNEIVAIKLKDVSQSASNAEKVADDDINHIVQDRSFMQANCLRGKGKDCRYAIKKLQDTSFNDASTFINGVVDLAVEARFLAVIRHPNIIKMRATCLGTPFSPEYFVVLDRLYDIMGQRITKWKKKQPKGLGRMMDRKGKKELAFWLERVTVAYDLGCAIKYLHDSNIIYRDIKRKYLTIAISHSLLMISHRI